MSIDATEWAWSKQGLRPLHKLVLLRLADRARSDNTIWPSYNSLIEDTGADRKTIWHAINALKNAGLLADTGERKGRTGQVHVLRLVGVYSRKSESKQFQKGNDSENGTVPFFPPNSSENGTGNSSVFGTRNLPMESISEPTNKNAQQTAQPLRKKSPSAQGFEEFFSRYPIKRDRSRAKAAWEKLKPDAGLVDRIFAAIEKQKATEQWQRGIIPHPTTWLNGRRWEDEFNTGPCTYTPDALAVFDRYNATLGASGWPEAHVAPFSAERAAMVSRFKDFSSKPDWIANYFAWLRENLEPIDGLGFDWALSEKTYLRAKEGNFAALREAA